MLPGERRLITKGAGSFLSNGQAIIHLLTYGPSMCLPICVPAAWSLQLLGHELVPQGLPSWRFMFPGASISQAGGKRTWHHETATDQPLQ